MDFGLAFGIGGIVLFRKVFEEGSEGVAELCEVLLIVDLAVNFVALYFVLGDVIAIAVLVSDMRCVSASVNKNRALIQVMPELVICWV